MGNGQRLPEAGWSAPSFAIADESERLRLFVDAVGEYAIFLMSPDGAVMTWNAGAERLKGYAGPEILGRHFSVFYTAEDIAACTPELELLGAAQDGLIVGEGWRVRKDGSRFWAHEVITALYEGPRLRGYAKVTRDDTVPRAAYERGLAMQDIIRGLLVGAEPGVVLAMVISHARHLTGAGRGWLATRQGLNLVVRAAQGPLPGPQVGAVFPSDPVTSGVITTGQPAFVADLRASGIDFPGVEGLGAALLVPLATKAGVTGVLIAAAPTGACPFRDSDLELLQAFATQAALVLGYDLAQQALRGQHLSDDRERIARDLHDHVIQQLFATGIGLQSMASRASDPQVRAMVEEAVDRLDTTIRQIRTTIFDLQGQSFGSPGSVGAHIAALVLDAGRALTFQPTLHLEGEIDTLVDPPTCEHLVAALSELLSNVARHAQATAAKVLVSIGDEVVLTVTDNGTGPPKNVVTGTGLRNLQARANALAGSFDLSAAVDRGAVATLRIPLPRRGSLRSG